MKRREETGVWVLQLVGIARVRPATLWSFRVRCKWLAEGEGPVCRLLVTSL